MTTLIYTPLLTSPLFFEKGRGISGNEPCVYWREERIIPGDCHSLGDGWEIGFYVDPETGKPGSVEAHLRDKLHINYYLENARELSTIRENSGTLTCMSSSGGDTFTQKVCQLLGGVQIDPTKKHYYRL